MPSTSLVQKNSAAAIADLKSYAALKSRVKKRLALGRQRAEAELVRTYWDVGRMINTHIQVHRGRAEYGEQVLVKLSEDVDLDVTVLRRTAQFATAFPIRALGRELTWSHFRALLAVDDEKTRHRLARETEEKGWTKEKLEEEIGKLNIGKTDSAAAKASIAKTAPLPAPALGRFLTYRIFQPKTAGGSSAPLRLDLGFHVYADLGRVRAPRGLKEGDIVNAEGRRHSRPGSVTSISKGGTESNLYTYRAVVEDVVDGDTLRVHIDLGLGMWVRQYLRLAHIDAPELKTKSGKAAREFALREIRHSPVVTLRTTKHDKFDRYLADIFLEDGTYLNQRILDAGHAARVEMS